jgi:hypothetical protein
MGERTTFLQLLIKFRIQIDDALVHILIKD